MMIQSGMHGRSINECRINDCRSYECRWNNCRSNETPPSFHLLITIWVFFSPPAIDQLLHYIMRTSHTAKCELWMSNCTWQYCCTDTADRRWHLIPLKKFAGSQFVNPFHVPWTFIYNHKPFYNQRNCLSLIQIY